MEPPGQSPAAQTLLGPTGTVGEPEVDAYVQFRLGLPYTGTVFQSGPASRRAPPAFVKKLIGEVPF